LAFASAIGGSNPFQPPCVVDRHLIKLRDLLTCQIAGIRNVRCRPVANSKGYTCRPMILTVDLERERKLLVTKLMLQFRKQRK
jgi:hypothetical protein